MISIRYLELKMAYSSFSQLATNILPQSPFAFHQVRGLALRSPFPKPPPLTPPPPPVWSTSLLGSRCDFGGDAVGGLYQCASLCVTPGYGLVVQEELVSPASMQYSLPSPLGNEPYWQEVSSMECAPIATTEEDTLMEMSEVQVWPSGNSPSIVAVEDSSLECSNADDSEALQNRSLGHSRSGTPGGNGLTPGGLSGSIELLEDQSIGADSDYSAAGMLHLSEGVNISALERGQGSERSEGAVGHQVTNNIKDGSNGGLGEGGGDGTHLEDSISLISGQQRVYARMSESPGLRRRADPGEDR